jgi:diguanylate cyclase (GGDEF)-like protein
MCFKLKQSQHLLYFLIALAFSGNAVSDEIRIALIAERGTQRGLEKWQSTADFLSKAIPEHRFVMVPFENNSSLNQAFSQGIFHFSLTNPASSVEHIIRYKTQPVATLINKRQGKGYSKFGSVIFTRADRNDINSIQDLKGNIFLASDELGFGGWRVTWREFLNHKINPYTDFKEIRFAGGNQPNVVFSVLNGKADAGTVRTDMLERMATAGKIKLSDFKILGKKSTSDFPFLHSTDLYPEWLVTSAKTISLELKNQVASALVSIKQNDKAALDGMYIGWMRPLNYSSVDDLLKTLKVGPYHISESEIFSHFIKQYFYIISLSLFILISFIAAFFYTLKLNRKIANTQESLENEITQRQRVENVLTTLAQQSLDFSQEDSFFNQCLVSLSDLFGSKFAFIGIFANLEKTRIKTYSVWSSDYFADNFEYELKGTPCQDVLDLKEDLISKDAAKKYPNDELLTKMSIDSYFGSPLISPSGEIVGLVSVMDDKPLNPDINIRPILKIFANRLALEMQRKKEEEALQDMTKQLSYQATHDTLTGLINRREFEVRMKNAWNSAINSKEQHALCYMDLDQFKIVNDTCGHKAGDELLKQLAIRLASIVRGSDTISRLGGDEFGVLFLDCPMERAKSLSKALLDAIRSFQFIWGDNVFEIGASIGLVHINQNSRGIHELLQAADSACYVAKDLGRNRIHIYKEDDIAIASRKGEMRWISEIYKAFENDNFLLYRQPIKPINSNNSPKEQYEFLLRMKNDKNGIFLPGSFISAAERFNLMLPIDKWVIENCFSFINLHYSKEYRYDHNNILYSINLSGLSISNESLPGFIDSMTNKYEICPKTICFEITETAAITNFSQAVKFIEEMKQKGFSFALDDFGTGLCSYAYLRSLPVSYLKIDGRFISGIHDDPMNKAIIESIVHIAKVLQIQTIAEWVEDEDILNKLKKLNVDYVQGFGIDMVEPLPKYKYSQFNYSRKIASAAYDSC